MYDEICDKLDNYVGEMPWEEAFEQAKNDILTKYEEEIEEAAEEILDDFGKGYIYEEYHGRD